VKKNAMADASWARKKPSRTMERMGRPVLFSNLRSWFPNRGKLKSLLKKEKEQFCLDAKAGISYQHTLWEKEHERQRGIGVRETTEKKVKPLCAS